MQTRDHRRIGQYLWKHLAHNASFGSSIQKALCRQAFIWGCVEPDINFLTYFRSMKHSKSPSGHHVPYIFKPILNIFFHLQASRTWHSWHYYQLGKAFHYIVDAFTFCHNEAFTGTLAEHVAYEKQLHDHLSSWLTQAPAPLPALPIKSLGSYFKKSHDAYCQCPNASTLENDCAYMLNVCACIFFSALLHPYPENQTDLVLLPKNREGMPV